jgi:hypothetical protein
MVHLLGGAVSLTCAAESAHGDTTDWGRRWLCEVGRRVAREGARRPGQLDKGTGMGVKERVALIAWTQRR